MVCNPIGITFSRLLVLLGTVFAISLRCSLAKPVEKGTRPNVRPPSPTARSTPAWRSWSVLVDPEIFNDFVPTRPAGSDGELLTSPEIFEGDMLGIDPDITEIRQPASNMTNPVATSSVRVTWPNNLVPYIFSNVFRPQDKRAIQEALQDFMAKTGVVFQEREDSDDDYVYIAPGFGFVSVTVRRRSSTDFAVYFGNTFFYFVNISPDPVTGNSQSLWAGRQTGISAFMCSSYVGRAPGRQLLVLQVPGCLKRGYIHHELMHTVGFHHEQSRTNRDENVEINWDNIPTAQHSSFQAYGLPYSLKFLNALQPYDIASLMHYGMFDFAIDKHVWTIRPRSSKNNALEAAKMGQRDGLSAKDVAKIKLAYPRELTYPGTTCPEGSGWVKRQSTCYFFSFLADAQPLHFGNATSFCRKKSAQIAAKPNETIGKFFASQMLLSPMPLVGDARIYVAN